MLSKTILAAAIAAALSVPILTATAAPADAKVCLRSEVTRLGDWRPTWAGARYSALWAWKRRVSNRWGSSYATWLRSEDRRYDCWSSAGRKRCRAIARPCRAGS